jgi:hypothetical protein
MHTRFLLEYVKERIPFVNVDVEIHNVDVREAGCGGWPSGFVKAGV